MKDTILLICLMLSTIIPAQNKVDVTDKIVDEMCSNFRQNENLSDSARIQILNEKYIIAYLNSFPQDKRKERGDNLYFRFQKNCQDFREYLYRVDPPKDDNWVRLSERPKIDITDSQIKEFKNSKNFYYNEYAGEKTKVKTDKKHWIETFADGTNSKLLYYWIDTNKFELEFIESNNNGRKNFSKKGDKYVYEVIGKENNYYWIFVEVHGQSELLKFKLFEEK